MASVSTWPRTESTRVRRLLDQLGGVALRLLLRLGRRLQLDAGFLGDLLDPADRFFRLRRLLHALGELGDLDVHRPDHLVDAVRLDDGVLDRLLLALDRLALAGDVLGERVERGQPLLGAAAEVLQLRERAELRFDFLDHRHRRRRCVARLARGVAQLGVVLGQRRRRLANLLQLALQHAGLADRLLRFHVRGAQLRAQFFECRPLLLERLDRRLRLQRLRRQLQHRLAMLLQLAVRSNRPLGRLLGLLRGRPQRLDARVEVRDLLRSIVEAVEPLLDAVEPRCHRRGHLHRLLHRVRERRQLGAARGERRQHRADRAAFLAGGRDQQFELGRLLLDRLALVGAADMFLMASAMSHSRVETDRHGR